MPERSKPLIRTTTPRSIPAKTCKVTERDIGSTFFFFAIDLCNKEAVENAKIYINKAICQLISTLSCSNFCQFQRVHLRHMIVVHGDAVDNVGFLHGFAVMGNNDELGFVRQGLQYF